MRVALLIIFISLATFAQTGITTITDNEGNMIVIHDLGDGVASVYAHNSNTSTTVTYFQDTGVAGTIESDGESNLYFQDAYFQDPYFGTGE